MDEKQTVNVSFTLEEVNQMLNFLGEQPAKYSLDLITFIRGKAQAVVDALPKEEAPQVKE